MTATIPTPTLDVAAASATTGTERRPRLRRGVQVALPAVAGALLVFATAADPGGSESGKAMVETYAANVDQLQWHASTLHWAYGLWGVVPLALLPLIRGRGRRLAEVAAVLGFLVMVSLPGLMLSDLFFAAIANEHGIDAAMRMYDNLGAEQWALKSYMIPGVPSLALCLPVAFAALARARKAPWWGVLVAILIMPAFFASFSSAFGLVAVGALFATLSVLVARATRA